MTLAFWTTRCQRAQQLATWELRSFLFVHRGGVKFDFRRFNGESQDETRREHACSRNAAWVSTHNAAATVAARIGDEGVGRR